MTKNSFWLSLPLSVFVALLAAFLFTTPAFAQDEVPPEVVPTEAPVEVLPTEAAPIEDVPTEAPADVLPTETASAEEVPSELAPVEEALNEEPSLAGTLADAGVVLADENGVMVSLASQDAQELVNNSDPWFKVGTITYRFLRTSGDCDLYPVTDICVESITDTPIFDAIEKIKGGFIPIDGMIHFEDGTVYDEDVIIDNVTGLKGMVGTISADTMEPNVTINGTLTISNMLSGFILDGFNILSSAGAPDTDPADGVPDQPHGVLDLFNTAGAIKLSNLVVHNSNATGQGIAIGEPGDFLLTHTRSVEMTNVVCSDNAGGGALITANGAVTLKNSSFEDNGGDSYVSGLFIDTKGSILMDGISVSRNGATNPRDRRATHIENSGAITIKNSVFNNNYFTGLFNANPSKGAILLENVTASNNRYFIDLDLEYGGAGILMFSNGNFTANNVSANGNKYDGMSADTCKSIEVTPGNWVCTMTSVGNVKITNSQFNGNFSPGQGLWVNAKGSITLSSVDVSNNRGYYRDPMDPEYGNPSPTAGARLNNFSSAGVYPVSVNTSRFDGNTEDGLEIRSKGLVTINKVKANAQGDDLNSYGYGIGIDIDNTSGTTAGVTFNGTSRADNEMVNYQTGVDIFSNGYVLINYLRAVSNYTNGVETKGNVTVNSSEFNSYSYSGLYVIADGSITLKDTNSWGFDGTTLDNSNAGSAKTVTVTGGDFSWSNGDGFNVFSKGSIILTNITVDDGYSSGAYLDNASYGGTGNITIKGSSFSNNDEEGLWIFTNGTLAITNTQGNQNGWDGLYTDYTTGAYPKSVTISGGNFDNNTIIGLFVVSKGAITLGNTTATGNGGNGASLYNQYLTPSLKEIIAPISVTKSFFDDNYYRGLNIVTYGAITLKDSSANGNYEWGAYLDNFDATIVQPVTVSGSVFDDNVAGGLNINSKGSVRLTNAAASANSLPGGDIAYGDQLTEVASTDHPDRWNFIGNAGDVISIEMYSEGINDPFLELWRYDPVQELNLLVSYNDDSEFTSDAEIIDFTLLESGEYFIIARTYQEGPAGAYNLRMWQDSEPYPFNVLDLVRVPGLVVTNTNGAGVTITNPANSNVYGFNNNTGTGMAIDTKGAVSLTGISASGNFAKGAEIGSPFAQVKSALISGMSTFYGNGSIGLEVYSLGAITLTNVDAASNGNRVGGGGAFLKNNYDSSPANISLLCTLPYWTNWYGQNMGKGLEIIGNGVVSVNKIDASDNEGDGLTINNNGSGPSANVTINTAYVSDNVGLGLSIITKGTVLINSLTANYNTGGVGASINNDYDSTGTKSVTINKSIFNGNSANGLQVGSHGNIIINNITATDNINGGSGAYLYNVGGTGMVTVLNTLGANYYNNNTNHGLWIASDLAVKITGVTASNNLNGYGIWVNNSGGSAPITLTKTTTNYNGLNGVFINSNGGVTLTSAVSMLNGLDDPLTIPVEAYSGIFIENHNALSKTSINSSVAIGNGAQGIRIVKHGGTYFMTNTLYFGNNASNDGYSNLWVTN